ncbi:MAG: ComF family protein [Candidatus Melainabacteria bacterium]
MFKKLRINPQLIFKALFLKGLPNLIYEPICPFSRPCKTLSSESCSNDNPFKQTCQLCLERFHDDSVNLRTNFKHLEYVISSSKYLGETKRIIHFTKWVSPSLSEAIAEIMALSLEKKLKDLNSEIPQKFFDFIVPIPGINDKKKGWITSKILAKHLSQLTQIPLLDNILTKTKETKFYRLTKKGRSETIQKAYSRSTNLEELDEKPRKILLVDDLIASGLTLETCAKEIKSRNNQHQIFGITFARSFI